MSTMQNSTVVCSTAFCPHQTLLVGHAVAFSWASEEVPQSFHLHYSQVKWTVGRTPMCCKVTSASLLLGPTVKTLEGSKTRAAQSDRSLALNDGGNVQSPATLSTNPHQPLIIGRLTFRSRALGDLGKEFLSMGSNLNCGLGANMLCAHTVGRGEQVASSMRCC